MSHVIIPDCKLPHENWRVDTTVSPWRQSRSCMSIKPMRQEEINVWKPVWRVWGMGKQTIGIARDEVWLTALSLTGRDATDPDSPSLTFSLTFTPSYSQTLSRSVCLFCLSHSLTRSLSLSLSDSLSVSLSSVIPLILLLAGFFFLIQCMAEMTE